MTFSVQGIVDTVTGQLPLSGKNETASSPSFMSSISDKISAKMPKCMQGPVGDTVIFQKASAVAEKGLTNLGKNAAEGSLKATVSKGGINFLGKMSAVAKGIPVAGVAISALFEAPAIVEGFKEGRGAAQIMKSTASVTGTTVGAIAGAALTPFCPFIGGAIGAVVGGWIGNKIGGGLFGSNKDKTNKEQAATPVLQQAPVQFGNMTAPNAARTMAFDINNPLAGLPQLT